MDRIPDTPPIIPALHETTGIERPLWSVMIPVYNCFGYLREALESVMLQAANRTDMQIEVVDDSSTDSDVAQIVEEIGKGRITYFRQEENVGSLRNFETCILRSKGKLIHLLHGDDIVLPGFYTKMQELFKDFPEAGAAFCRYQYINEKSGILYPSDIEKQEDGILDNWLTRLYQHQRIQTPSIVVKRSVYENLGSFYAVHYGEDWEMWLRIAAHYPFAYTPEILASYRQHPMSISGQYFLSGQNIRDLKTVMDLTEKYIPLSERKTLRKEAEEFYSKYAIGTARMLWSKYKDHQAVRAQIKEAGKMYKNAWINKEILKLKIKMMLNIS
ncbi:MAG TPA: glycosyltransferase [Flavipsychrobacter sp.]|nr:glycosyltransferase [Flavipsychrobacter sp.]